MITRYDTPEISELWTDQSRFSKMLEVEVALLKSLEKHNKIPKNTVASFNDVKINISRIEEIERKTKHDIIAFCSSITEQVDPKVSKYFHFGVTSSDIIDTALSLQMNESIELIIINMKALLNSLKKKAIATKDILATGRSHGISAEPIIFGQKFLSHYYEFKRRLDDLIIFKENSLTGQLSGAVGNYTILTPEIEKDAILSLGLKVEPVSTQVIPRDYIAKLLSITSLCACAVERMATEIRLLHHSDIAEVSEGFSQGQKGSSTMPHKKNPISGENLSGIARVIKSHYFAALENTVLWHERDISHSSAERIILPDNLGLLNYSVKRLTSTIDNLVVHKDKIEEKALNNHNCLSSYYLHELIENTELTREEIYTIIQKASFESKSQEEFITITQSQIKDYTIKKINIKELKNRYTEVFDQKLKDII